MALAFITRKVILTLMFTHSFYSEICSEYNYKTKQLIQIKSNAIIEKNCEDKKRKQNDKLLMIYIFISNI